MYHVKKSGGGGLCFGGISWEKSTRPDDFYLQIKRVSIRRWAPHMDGMCGAVCSGARNKAGWAACPIRMGQGPTTPPEAG